MTYFSPRLTQEKSSEHRIVRIVLLFSCSYFLSATSMHLHCALCIRLNRKTQCRQLFKQNLRSTRQTELTRELPVHVVACWMGNSPKVANEHYLQVTEDDYASVAVGSGNRGKRAETTHDPKDVVPFVASSCRNVTPSRNSSNGPYRTRTMCKNHREYATL